MSVREEIHELSKVQSLVIDGEIRLCDQIRVCRNLQGFLFPLKASSKDREAISSMILKALGHIMRPKANWVTIPWNTCTDTERQILKRICLLDFPCEETVIVYCKKNPEFHFIINDGDALRIQGSRPDFKIHLLWKLVNEYDDKLQKYLPYAFDPEKGYATSSPSNYGTGLNVRTMVHVPALCFKQKLIQIQEALKAMHLRMDPVEVLGDKILGHLFYVTHDVAQGCSEKDLLNHIDKVAEDIVKQEIDLQDHLWETENSFMRDSISRAIGVLKSCYELTFEEGMNLISVVLMGMDMGVVTDEGHDVLLSLWSSISPEHIKAFCEKISLKNFSENDIRAGIVRMHFSEYNNGLMKEEDYVS